MGVVLNRRPTAALGFGAVRGSSQTSSLEAAVPWRQSLSPGCHADGMGAADEGHDDSVLVTELIEGGSEVAGASVGAAFGLLGGPVGVVVGAGVER